MMRVIVATDGSPSACVALDLAAAIPWPDGTSIRVVEAIDAGVVQPLEGPWPAVTTMRSAALEDVLRRSANDVVIRAREALERPGVDVAAEVLSGRPATVIVEAARRFRADLIVVGSRGHGTIESMLLGSVSAEVVDHASVPVLVARRNGWGRTVLAWDGSPCGRVAADLVRDSPVFAASHVRVVSVADVGVPWWTGLPESGSPDTLPSYLEAGEESRRVHDRLAADMRDELRAAGLDAEAQRLDGDAAASVIDAARELHADVVVVGTHGRTGLARLVMGSVARNVVLHAPCSVLVARAVAGS